MVKNKITPEISPDTAPKSVLTSLDKTQNTDDAPLLKENQLFVRGKMNYNERMAVHFLYLKKKKQRGILIFYVCLMLILWSVVLWFWYYLFS